MPTVASATLTLQAVKQARVFGPLMALALALAVSARLAFERTDGDAGGLGPLDWPLLMALGWVLSALALCIARAWQFVQPTRPPEREAQWSPTASAQGTTYDNKTMALGVAGIVSYGIGVAHIGFAPATFLLIAYWLVINGVRRLRTILLTAAIGPVVLLYLFVKISYTPLPRGEGVFDSMSIALYQLLGIF